MKHPFLENTYLNIGIFNRTMKKFGEALMMFKRLEILQKQVYGEDNISLYYTYKNIGTCYLGIGQSETGRKYFRDCLKVLENAKYDHDSALKIKDKEEKAQIHQNLYLTFIADREYKKCIECS